MPGASADLQPNDPVSLVLPGRRADHRQPVHPARAALRLRTRRPAVRQVEPAAAARHGHHLRGRRQPRRARRRLGGQGQRVRPDRRPGGAGRVRPDAAVPGGGRPRHPAAGGARRAAVAVGVRARGTGSPVWPSFLLGIATGLLWAPCAGPILGLLLTGAALQGASVQTSLLLLAYAAGAAISLALALLAGKRVFAAMKRSLGAGEWVRRALGVAVLAGVVADRAGARHRPAHPPVAGQHLQGRAIAGRHVRHGHRPPPAGGAGRRRRRCRSKA